MDASRYRTTVVAQPVIAERSVTPSRVTDEASGPPVLAWLRWPHALVALSTLYGLSALRGETRFAQPLNDSAFHLQMVRWAGGQSHRGRVPLDGWYPWLSLGSSFFHHYESLPETLTAYAAAVTGASDNTAYLWLLYLPLATWPISVYAGSRLLGWGRWTAAGSAGAAFFLVFFPPRIFRGGTWAGGHDCAA